MNRMCSLYESRQMIKIIIRDIRNLLMFFQVDGKKLCDISLEIVKTDL